MFTALPLLTTASGRRGQRLALFDDIGPRHDRRRGAVLATVRHAGRHLERVARVICLGALTFDGQLRRAGDDIARFDPRMGVARDRRAGLDFDAGADGLVAGRWAIDALQDSTLE